MPGARPHITVIMPAYNAQRTVADAVASTLSSLPDDAMLIVRDDASSDGTLDVLKGVRDRRLVLVEGSQNIGVAAGLNEMLERVEGPLVARMDADDICLPWRFAKAVRAMRDVDLVFSSSLAMTNQRAITARNVPFAIEPSLFGLHLLIANPVTHSTMMGRVVAVRGVGGYRVSIAEDYDLWMRLAVAGHRQRRIALPTLRYRYHPGQLTADPTWLERVIRDDLLIDSYTRLSETVLGTQACWLPDLMRVWNRQAPGTGSLAQFGALVRAAGPRRPGPARVLLHRRLRKFGI